ncbi:MAG TPA: PspC domain-containing protein [Chitinophagaceae bacterium]|nr:PspC domain-containing protein [Chitinophagaceae bacterium]
MKKVININFQGRVIPIEETAYDILQQYIDSLRKYFANEEGRDEIINDIEGRIAELCSERLKKGSTCITDEDVNAVIAGMGRPSDFEQADAEAALGATAASAGAGSYSQQQQYQQTDYNTGRGRGRLYRNADDKILGGVCSGLANYLGIDPVVMRILFVVFVGALFWVYIVLWIIVPSQSAQSNITKRLYRSSDDKVIGGVCGGLAAYFNVSTWIPRLIFALPLIIGLISSPFNMWLAHDWDFWWGPKVVTGSLGFTLFVTYLILWISVPVAVTAAEKLEMRGERVDLNSIRNTVKEDLESFKSKAQNWGSEVKESAQRLGEKAKTFGQSAGAQAKTYSPEAPTARTGRSGIGHVIGILFKAFFLFIAGIIAISLFGVLMGLLFGGFVAFPFKDFFLEGFWQNALAWISLLFFLGIPIIALITWLIRRIVGVRSRNHYLGYVFGSLWTIGLIAFIFLIGTYARNFRMRGERIEPVSLVQPSTGKLYVDVAPGQVHYYTGGDWFGIDWDDDWPIYGSNEDTLMLNNIRIHVAKSKDSLYHAHMARYSQGRNVAAANALVDKIQFPIRQQDSMLILPKGFGISRSEKFRNQRVELVIEVPVGKRIQFDDRVNAYDWYIVNFSRRRGFNIEYSDDWDYAYGWRTGVEYIMNSDGRLQRTDKEEKNEMDVPNRPDTTNVNGSRRERSNNPGYRYEQPRDKQPNNEKKDSVVQEAVSSSTEEQPHRESPESLSPIYRLSRFAR